MKNISISFLFGLIGAITVGLIVFFVMYFLLRLPLSIDLDNKKIFYLAFYLFITIIVLATALGAIGGVFYGRKYKK